jgi:DNA-binding transcriptional ArsR family regulator
MPNAKSKIRFTPSASQMQAVAELFAVLSEPSRLSILQTLESGPKSVTQLIEETGMKQANVSKQLGILHKAGLLSRSREGNQVLYKIRMPLVFKLCDLVCGELHREATERVRLLAPE